METTILPPAAHKASWPGQVLGLPLSMPPPLNEAALRPPRPPPMPALPPAAAAAPAADAHPAPPTSAAAPPAAPPSVAALAPAGLVSMVEPVSKGGSAAAAAGSKVLFGWRIENFSHLKDIIESRKVFSQSFPVPHASCSLRLGLYESFDSLCAYVEGEVAATGSSTGPAANASAAVPAEGRSNFWVRYRLAIVNQRHPQRTGGHACMHACACLLPCALPVSLGLCSTHALALALLSSCHAVLMCFPSLLHLTQPSNS
jgi:hypothetical protein